MEVNRKCVWGLLLVLLLGQLVSFSMAASSFTSSLIANLGVDAPLAQSFFAYLLLILVYLPIVLYRRPKLQIAWYWYLALAFIDVQGNYLFVEAYQYSYITSVTLLDCWTIVWVIVLTWYALGTRYSFWQFVGAGTCAAGLALVLLSDAKSTDEQDPRKIPLLGDALVIAGTVCYAFSNVGEEYCVKKKDQQVEVVAMLGFFGLLVSTVQVYIFERKRLEAVTWSPTMIGLFAGYAMAFSVFYTSSGSTLFNLSLLTSDMWAVAIRVLFYRQQINWLYYLAFGVVAIGLIIYSLKLMEVDRDTCQFSLFLGQIVSFSMAVSSFTISVISSLGVDAPLAQLFVSYMLLALIPWYWYLALVFIDVQGNFLAIKAYQYSYITSINLLDSWTIQWVMILTRFALGTRYSFWQFVGAGTCMAGVDLVLLSDSNSPDVQDASKRPLLGDFLIIAATFCFAFSNVGEEYCVKKKDQIEVIAMLGIFGVLVTGIQISLFERKNLETINWSPTMISLFIGFAIAAFVYCTISSFVLKMSGSTMFNLSLLTTDIWLVTIRIFFCHQQVNWLYYLAFAVVAIGLVIYSLNESSSDDQTAASTTETATQYEQLSSEETGGDNLDWQKRKHQEDDHTC